MFALSTDDPPKKQLKLARTRGHTGLLDSKTPAAESDPRATSNILNVVRANCHAIDGVLSDGSKTIWAKFMQYKRAEERRPQRAQDSGLWTHRMCRDTQIQISWDILSQKCCPPAIKMLAFASLSATVSCIDRTLDFRTQDTGHAEK